MTEPYTQDKNKFDTVGRITFSNLDFTDNLHGVIAPIYDQVVVLRCKTCFGLLDSAFAEEHLDWHYNLHAGVTDG